VFSVDKDLFAIVSMKAKCSNPDGTVYVICRLGNDSQLAVKILEEHGIPSKDIVGGLHEWSHRIDTDFPIY
jgi:adenylyltransferase/sulfurtransferase